MTPREVGGEGVAGQVRDGERRIGGRVLGEYWKGQCNGGSVTGKKRGGVLGSRVTPTKMEKCKLITGGSMEKVRGRQMGRRMPGWREGDQEEAWTGLRRWKVGLERAVYHTSGRVR